MSLISDEFRQHVLDKLREDDIGELCRHDRMIIEYGKLSYDRIKRRQEKQVEVRKAVRSEMRRISHLYLCFKKQNNVKHIVNNASDMLKRENFLVLKNAIQHYTTKEDQTLKASLKFSIFYLLKNLAKCVKGLHLMQNQDSDARSVDDFLTLLELSKNDVFGEAQQAIHKDRQVRLRKTDAIAFRRRHYKTEKLHQSENQRYHNRRFSDVGFFHLHRVKRCRLCSLNSF